MNNRKCFYNILTGQHSTEKSVMLTDKYRSITFVIPNRVNKNDVKYAVEKIFGVIVLSVGIINVKGKKVRFKNIIGKSKSFKKAIVTLKKGYNINFLEFN
ncbi:MAG TPA: 50S ribosomal protein L23 [Candidatus Azoamicus sp. OHIO1]